MTTPAPSTLQSSILARRLRELAADERGVQVDFLLHLAEFDLRRAFLEAGHDSLWTYCLRELHLREGPAGRRIGAMRVLRRFPALEAPLRDGRLCISTVTLLGPLLTGENLDEIVARAAYRTKAEVEHLVASIQPRVAPSPGVRRLPERAQRSAMETLASAPPLARAEPERVASPPPAALTMPPSSQRAPEMRPVSAEEYSLRVTIDAGTKADLETLTTLLAHKSGGDLAAVLREAIRCGIEKHAKRRGATRPTCAGARGSTTEAVPAATGMEPDGPAAVSPRRAVPAAVRREVWRRDEGCCAWTNGEGKRCRSRWKLELDHIVPVALGGASTVENLRVLCRGHNALHAEQVFGRAHMERFTRAVHSSQDSSSITSRGALIPGLIIDHISR
jgi:hypothetical protein